MSEFIKKLKQSSNQNLIGSIIIVKSNYTKFLLKLIFLLQNLLLMFITESDNPQFINDI